MRDFSTLTTKGQLVLPKRIRDELHLEPGDRFIVTREGGSLRLIPFRVMGVDEALAQLPGSSKRFPGRVAEKSAMRGALVRKQGSRRKR
jgi:AbrB family looped-hinge helix DNA binding protein